MNESKNVSVGKPLATGAIFVAPSGTNVPTDAVSKLAETFRCVGYIGEDGVTNAVTSNSEPVKAWGGDTVLNTQTSREETFAFKMIEANEVSLEQAYGAGNINTNSADGSISIKHNSKERSVYVYVIEVILNDNKVKRVVVPVGKIIEMGDVVYKDNEPIGYEVTVSAMPDSSGNTAYEYIASAVNA
jgi:hypothetical protein